MNIVSIQTYFPQSLSRLIKSFWFLEVSDFCASIYEEEIIPDGHHEIIFHLNSLQAKRKTESSDWTKEPNAFLASQNLKSYKLQLQPGSKLFGIRFYPHTLFNFLRFPIINLTDKILSLNDVLDASGFWSCITDNPQETFSNFEKFLAERISMLDFHSNAYVYVNASVSEIFRFNGNVSVAQLIRKTGISAKYLDESFKQCVGITPKTLCRIIKLNHFISYKTNHPEKNFTECCYEADYYDQSHLIKSFYKFTNRSPKNYFGDDNKFINEIFTSL